MYSNNCAKCGTAFETKNPKRVICPACLYPDRAADGGAPPSAGKMPSLRPLPEDMARPGSSPGGAPRPGGYGPPRGGAPRQGGYGPPRGGAPRQGGYGPPRGGAPRQGGYGPPRGGAPRQGGYGPPRGGAPRPGGYGPPRGGRGGRGGPPQKKHLVEHDDMVKIEFLYKKHLPLPNPDVHEIIGAELELKPSIVFFAINLVRQKMKLPKLEYPKRKLAVSPEQLMAIEALYEAYLPLPPIGIHKIISKQLKMDEWRVHVGIGLIRKNKNLNRWNENRDDLPEHMKQSIEEARLKKEADAAAQQTKDAAEAKSSSTDNTPEITEAPEAPAKKPRKKAVKKVAAEESDDASAEESEAPETPVKKPRKKAVKKSR